MTARNIWLNINGTNRMLICDPEKDSLADLLRRIGLTGTKIGCNSGQCGACSVILDGEVVRSCARKMKNIPDHARVITIEGIGTSRNLHPLQRAWIKYGGVQCGFCTPGFIVSAYALLEKNADPTREEVRAWFKKHLNICRCTGYKPLVDAVMAAAAVLRGEQPPESLDYEMPEDGRIYNTRYPKPAAVERVTGETYYGDDLSLQMPPGSLHLAVVQPRTMHAKILGIDFSEAEKMPGVVKVITAKDVKGTNRATFPQTHPRRQGDGKVKPILCDEKIFRYGDIVAVVAAYTREQARAAAKAVKVELEELPVYHNALEAARPDAIRIHPENPNEYAVSRVQKGEDTRKVFREAAYTVEGSFSSTKQPHLVIEPDTLQAYYDEQGRVVVQSKSQFVYGNRNMMAEGVGLPPEMLRVIENPTGSSFGYSMTPGAPAIMAVCEMALGVPISLTMSYEEHQAFSGKRAGSFTNGRLACDEKGNIIGLEYDMVLDLGAYPEMATMLLTKGQRFIGWPYRVPNITGLVRGALSNVSYGITFRSFGSPQCYTTSEALMDMMARRIGMDRLEFRYQNVAQPGDTTPNSRPYHQYPMRDILDRIRPYYQAAVERSRELSTDEKKRGVGIVCGGYHVSFAGDRAEVELELMPDGSIAHYNTWEDVGQGGDTGTLMHTHEALRPLGIRPDQIRLVQNDTARAPNSGQAGGSRSHFMVGKAIIDAANRLMDAMRKDDGTYRTYDEMKAEGIPTRYRGVWTASQFEPIDVDFGHGDASPQQNYMALLAEVEVDVASGKTRVLSMRAVSDIGVVGNYLAVEGQAYGSFSQAIGFALQEDYSDMKKHATLIGAGVPQIDLIPDDLEIMFRESRREDGPHQSAGCAESFQGCAHMGVLNAIEDAVGVRIYELPATPEKIRAALAAKAAGKELKPEKYRTGSDFYETSDYIAAHPLDPLNKR